MRKNLRVGMVSVLGILGLSAAAWAEEPTTQMGIPVPPIYVLKETPKELPFMVGQVTGMASSQWVPTAVIELPAGTKGVHHSLPHLELKGYAGAKDVSAKVQICADNDNLYFFFDVTDDIVINDAPADTIWGGDKVEIYLAAPDVNGKSSGKARQIIVSPPSAGNLEKGAIRIWDKNQDIKGLKYVGYATETGYIIQIVVPRTVLADQGVPRLEDGFKYSVDISDADSIYMKGVPHVPVKTDLIPYGNMANYTLQNTELWATAKLVPQPKAQIEPQPADSVMVLHYAPDPKTASDTFQLRMKLTDPQAFTEAAIAGFVKVLGTKNVSAADATYAMIGLSLVAKPMPEYVEAIVPYLKSENSDLRSTAATCLARLKLHEADPALRAAASDPIMGNRCNAIEALGVVGNEDLVDFLKTYLQTPQRHPYEISTALQVLGERGDASLVPFLQELAKSVAPEQKPGVESTIKRLQEKQGK